ncbi:MAG: NDP-sugar synthase [Chloroflexota bacterium]|nr:NDP-sugar synthase [Chloroflexota bacterium]
MKAVILVGGGGTRLRPLTYSMPKPMVPIVNRPFLEHMLTYMKRYGIDEVILALCYLPDHIQSYFGDGSDHGIRLRYAIEERPLGTAGAVKNVSDYIDDTFFVFNGDVFTDIDLNAMLELHQRESAKVTIALTPVENPTIYGVVETETSGRVKRFIEKPGWDAVTTNMINAGVYVLDPEVMEQIPGDWFYMFEHGLFPSLLESEEPIYGYGSNGYWIDIGTPEKYMNLNFDLLSGETSIMPPGKEHGGGIWLEEGVTIHPDAKVVGPVAIGRNSTIDAGVRISGPSVIGPDCFIGAESYLKETLVWQNVNVGREANLQGCVIADGVSIGDNSAVPRGCVLGQNVSIESNSALSPETKAMPGESLPSSEPTRS